MGKPREKMGGAPDENLQLGVMVQNKAESRDLHIHESKQPFRRQTELAPFRRRAKLEDTLQQVIRKIAH